MATPGTGLLPATARAEARFLKLNKELEALTRQFEDREKQELAALEEAKRAIEDEIHQERDSLASQLPGQLTLPETFEKFLIQKRDSAIRSKEEKYKEEKAERQKRFETLKAEHLLKFRNAISSEVQSTIPEARLPETQPQQRPSLPPISVPSIPRQEPKLVTEPRRIETERQVIRVEEAPRPLPAPVQYQHQQRPQPQPQLPPAIPSTGFIHRHDERRLPPANVLVGSSGRPGAVMDERHPQQQSLPRQHVANGAQFTSAVPEQHRGFVSANSGYVRQGPLVQANHQAPHSSGRTPLPGAPDSSVAMSDMNSNAKRKSDSRPTSSHAGSPKRQKLKELGDSNGTADKTQVISSKSGQKTITFEEVYQNGNAKFKHIIVEYPASSNQFYILRCDEHMVHFNLNPLAGAAKHLHSAQHGHMSKERTLAVELLGYQVVGCNSQLAEKNNAEVKKAFDEGYRPLNLNQMTRAERESFEKSNGLALRAQKPAAPPPPPPQAPPPTVHQNVYQHTFPQDNGLRSFTGLTNPVDNELYLAYWAKERKNYAVLKLPLNGDLRHLRMGMEGTLADTGLMARAPQCYAVDGRTNQITGWAKGYEDGGPYMTKREFPVMYFDGRMSVGWVRAKDLSPFVFEHPHWRDIPYFREAREHYAQIRQFPSYDAMRQHVSMNKLKSIGPSRPVVQYHQHATRPQPAPAMQAGRSAGVPAVVRGDYHSHAHPRVSPHPQPRRVPLEDVSMVDDSDRDSYQESMNRSIMDSDNDVEMTGTDSRRTSISNRDEPLVEHSRGLEGLKKLTSSVNMPPVGAEINGIKPTIVRVGDHYPRPGPVATGLGIQAHPNPLAAYRASEQRGSVDPRSEMAQRIAAKALVLQSPERKSQNPLNSAMNSGAPRGYQPTENNPPTHSTTGYRSSESPKTMVLPDRRTNGSSPQQEPLNVLPLPVPRNSSPASLHNILHNPANDSTAPPQRLSPLQQVAGFATQPPSQQGLQHPHRPAQPEVTLPNINALTQQPAQQSRSTNMLAPRRSPQNAQTQLQKQSGADQDAARSVSSTPAPASNPPSRTSTPIVLSGNEAAVADRWRAVRTVSSSEPAAPRSPPLSVQPQVQPQPEPHSPTDTPREVPSPVDQPRPQSQPKSTHTVAEIPTPTPSANTTRANSPNVTRPGSSSLVKSESAGLTGQLQPETIECDLLYYKDSNIEWTEEKKPPLRLRVDPERKVAVISPRDAFTVTLDPQTIKKMVMESAPALSKMAWTVLLTVPKRDGGEGDEVLTLGFDSHAATAGRGIESGRIHARRFVRWANGVNQGINFLNSTFDPSRRTTQNQTAANTITVE